MFYSVVEVYLGKGAISNTHDSFCMTVFRLEFGTAPSAEPGAPPVITNDILAMISPEGESVPLLKVLAVLTVVHVQYTCT